MNIVGGYQDTRRNNADFAITPYLFVVIARLEFVQVYGIGICWGFYSAYIGIGFGVPKKYRWVKNIFVKPKSSI